MIDLDALCTCGHTREQHDSDGRYCEVQLVVAYGSEPDYCPCSRFLAWHDG